MFAKTSIAVAIVVAICSGAVAAEKRNSTANAYVRSAPIVHCAHGVWDAYALRCDAAE
jgi:hypothetical protein